MARCGSGALDDMRMHECERGDSGVLADRTVCLLCGGHVRCSQDFGDSLLHFTFRDVLVRAISFSISS